MEFTYPQLDLIASIISYDAVVHHCVDLSRVEFITSLIFDLHDTKSLIDLRSVIMSFLDILGGDFE